MGQLGYLFNVIFTYPIFNLLMLLDHVLGDFGLSIIVLTVLIRLILFPLTLRQLKSTKAMQAVQPLIADVKKQYPKDQRAQLEATQAIYKEYGINPAAGCLPLFIQLPVLYGLFNSLNTVLRNHPTVQSINSTIYPFLPHITRLPDANLNWFTFLNPHWFINLGAIDPTHILPVLAGVATFIQLRMSQPRTSSATKNAMTQQMQIMQFIMPVITLVFALGFPAGLALYWTTTSLFSMVQQYFVTGWGSLFDRPSFIPGGNNSGSNGKSKNYTGDQRKETRVIEAKSSNNGTSSTGGSAGSKLSTYSNGANGNGSNSASSASARRRVRPGSASARRRGNVPKRNPSRS
ncbi:MAG TPA: YidC/Oxa1 family membrane protein insertase [Ktedonobacteraceae bacterium]|nr:YidC/Oxa1 family membrane protein insertase [Ktedonobacteraceae bacterium]